MSIIVFVILMSLIFGKTKRDNRRSSFFGVGVGTLVVLGLLSIFLPWLIGFGALGLAGFIGYQIYKKNKNRQQQQNYGWDASQYNNNQAWQRSTQQNNASSRKAKTTLPQAPAKRRKVVESFNAKYNLYLTEGQMQSIVNSSYMSEIWRKELEAMSYKYANVYEWFQGYTKWLRVYLYVFHVQEVTSDIRQQETICTYAFEEVFKYVDTLKGLSLSEKIARVNDKFYAAFDDVSFMIAYRYLEEKGLKHDLSGPDIIRDEEEIDELLKKYEKSGQDAQGGQTMGS